jgi:uncharacterized phage protein gp47/JayE
LPFTRRSYEQIAAAIKTDIQGALEGTAAFFRRSFERGMQEALTGASHHLHGHLDWNARQLDPRTADEDNLEKIHGEPFGVFRKAATKTQFTLTATGVDGTLVPALTVWIRSDGARYLVDQDAIVDDGEVVLALTAEQAGAEGNCDNGTELSIDPPLAGLDNEAVVLATTVVSADRESKEDYFERVRERRQRPLRGGAPGDYRTWTLEVPGVTRAWEFPRQEGAGTVSIFAVNDAADPITLSGPKLTEIATYIEQPGRAPSTTELFVYTPTLLDLGIVVSLSPDTTAVENAVKASITDFLRRVATPEGMTVLLSQLNEAISQAAGEVDHELVSPVANVVVPFGSLPTAGEPTFGPL